MNERMNERIYLPGLRVSERASDFERDGKGKGKGKDGYEKGGEV